MKKFVLIIFSMLVSFQLVSAQSNYSMLITKADSLYQVKDYKKSNKVYTSAFKLERNNKLDLYNGACAAALAGDYANAFKFLNLSVDNGWSNIAHFNSDADLQVLHDKPQWKQVVEKLYARIDQVEASYNKDAKNQLEEVYKTDQGIRNEFIAAQKTYGYKSAKVDSLTKLMIYHDSLNTHTVIKILDKYGWLGEDEVGSKANLTLFLVIQHAKLKVQQKYLPMLRNAVKDGKAQASSLALLEDRVALREGNKQIYGSQLSSVPNKPEQYYLSPLIDPDHVDERRASVGLGPIAEYVKNWSITWNVEEYKKHLPEYEKWADMVKW